MDELRELYQTLILDHNKKPRNFREIEGASHQADGHNPLCGDKLTVYAVVEDGRVADLAFVGSGCAISKASASMMTEFVKGMTLDEARGAFERFHRLVTADATEPAEAPDLGKLAVFAGVREFPMRVKCATLAWHTLKSALDESGEVAKTE